MLKVGVVALDGTKIEANASLSSNRSEKYREGKVKKILKEASETDKVEDKLYGRGAMEMNYPKR